MEREQDRPIGFHGAAWIETSMVTAGDEVKPTGRFQIGNHRTKLLLLRKEPGQQGSTFAAAAQHRKKVTGETPTPAKARGGIVIDHGALERAQN